MGKISKLPLKYQGYAIVLQEVPDEISLAFNICGCVHHCEGCHSTNLWEYNGNYISEDLSIVLAKYKDYISCVCFMGGDQNIDELLNLCKSIKSIGLKTCVYSGVDTIECFEPLLKEESLDYLKIGKYEKEYGGLDNPNTNQKMYKIINKRQLECINNKFQKSKI